jgi:hypothetical protein
MAGAVHPSLRWEEKSNVGMQSRSRLELARDEIDRVFGEGHAAAHPELVIAVMNAASSDWAASRLAVASEGQGYAVDGSAAAALGGENVTVDDTL